MIAHASLTLIFLLTGQWIAFLLNAPLVAFNVNKWVLHSSLRFLAWRTGLWTALCSRVRSFAGLNSDLSFFPTSNHSFFSASSPVSSLSPQTSTSKSTSLSLREHSRTIYLRIFSRISTSIEPQKSYSQNQHLNMLFSSNPRFFSFTQPSNLNSKNFCLFHNVQLANLKPSSTGFDIYSPQLLEFTSLLPLSTEWWTRITC